MIADVALPLPLQTPLAYAVPEPLRALARAGIRVRVPAGKRRLVGWIVGFRERAPEGVELREIEEVLDLEPVLTPELLELARFVSDYYLAPPGEVLRSMLPADLAPWGDHRVWLTDAGAIAPPRDADEAAIVEALREAGRLRVSELQRRTGLAGLGRALEALRDAGRVALGDRRSRGTRYVSAVELAPGELAAHLAVCGRSAAGQAVVRHLFGLGRPARMAELQTELGASEAVLRRLVRLGVLHQFSEAERLPLDRHRLRAAAEVPAIVLRADQQAALAAIEAGLVRRTFAPFLLVGVTGAGKTEVFLRAAEASVAQGRAAILLVPEIALVPALAAEVARRFGSDFALLHSGLGEAERHQEWERIRSGEARVVLGPRSALFAPVADLGLIVVDEEQDPAYKQESTPRYSGRDLALVRGARAGAAVVLVSATPSLESRHNVERGKLVRLDLAGRVGGASLPAGVLVDLRQEPPGTSGKVHFSAALEAALTETLAAGDQAILLRNRRGYAPLLLCRACGEDMRCADCGLPRTLHRRERRLLCHYCGSTVPVPERCPSCGEAALEPVGAGTERIEEEFRALFPGVPTEVLDRDAVRRRGSVAVVLERFARGDAQVLIGTQMVSKGHHFPRVALTAVLQADAYLGFPDFRAVERTYTLLVQLGGRAGRGERPGRVVVQTYHPEHYAIQAALRNDDAGFAEEELRFRRLFHYPPYTRMVQLLTRSRHRDRAETVLQEIAARMSAHPAAAGIRVLGPAPAPLERLRGEWRFQLLLRGESAGELNRLVREVLPEKPAADLSIDVDPQHLL
ncbi:MAG: primosomal protein N' [Acidobacteriota bacterium]